MAKVLIDEMPPVRGEEEEEEEGSDNGVEEAEETGEAEEAEEAEDAREGADAPVTAAATPAAPVTAPTAAAPAAKPGRVTTIRGGLLIALSVSVKGGVSYEKKQLQVELVNPDGSAIERWETTKVLDDKVEHEMACETRTTARNGIVGACISTAFGLLCPDGNEGLLWSRVSDAEAAIDAFNANASTCRVEMHVLPGRIAADNAAAARAILGEAASLLDEMQRALSGADVDAVRKAADSAKALNGMLDGAAGDAVNEAVRAARKVARQVVRRVEKFGDDASEVIAEHSSGIGAIVASRRLLIDLIAEIPADAPAAAPAAPAADATGAAAVDADDATTPTVDPEE